MDYPQYPVCSSYTPVIRRILKHLRLWELHPKEPDHPARDPPWPANATTPLTCHPVPDKVDWYPDRVFR